MKPSYTRIGILVGVFLPLSIAHAQSVSAGGSDASALAELSLEQLMDVRIDRVFSASKYEQKVTRAPASVSIVTADEMRDFGHRTLAEALRSVRGLYLSDDSNYSYLGARGFLRPGDYNTRVLMLVDGHRVNDAIYTAAYIDQANQAEIDMIERVEVIRGPSSSIYGSSAFFGVLNIVTRKAADFSGAEVSAEAGSFGSSKARLSYGREFSNGTDLVFSASLLESDGRDRIYYPVFDERISTEPRARNHGFAEDSDGETAVKLSGNVKHGPFTLSGMFSKRRKFVPTASFDSAFNDGREKTIDRSGYLDLQYDHEFDPDLRLVARTYFDRYQYEGDYPYEFAQPGNPSEVVFSQDSALGESVGAELQLTARLKGRHTVVTGGEFRYAFKQDQDSYYDTTPRDYVVDESHAERTIGLYAQGEFQLRRGLILNAGLRYDYYPDGFGSTSNPRLGLIYNPSESMTFKALYGRAYRAPNSFERYYNVESPSPLTPERIETAELVFEHYFAGVFRLGVSGYQYEVTDLISQFGTMEVDPAFTNHGRIKARGVEFELARKSASGLQVRSSYALQRAEDSDSGEAITNSPRHLAKLNLIVPLAKEHLAAGLELQYHSALRTITRAKAGDFLLANLTFTSRGLLPGLELSASAYNLFNTAYGYPGAEDHTQDVLPQPGRTLRLKATYRF